MPPSEPLPPDPRPESSRSRGGLVARAGLIMMASLFLSRVLGITRDAVIAGMFGADQNTDAYRLAFQVPDLLFFLIAGGALSSAFIPVFSEYLHTGREDDAWKVFSVVATAMSVLVTLFIVAAFVFAEPLARLVAPGKPDELMPLIAQMSRIVLPAQLAFFIGGLLFGTLYARQVFAVPGLGPNVYNLGIIVGAVALSGLFTPGVVGMSWGALLGAVIGNLVLPLLAMKRMGSRFTPSLELSHPGVLKVFKLMLPVVLGLSLPGVYGLITLGFGSFYEAGVVTSLDFANKLMQAPLGIFGQALAIAVFPTLSQHFAQGEMGLFRSQLATTLRTVIFITVPVSALMGVFAPEIVTVLFQHGKFGPAMTASTAAMLGMFSIGIFAWCLHPVLMRAFFSVQNSITPVIVGTLTTGLFIALALAFRQSSLEHLGLPLASSISAIVLAGMLLFGVRGRIGGIDLRGIGWTLAKTAFAALVAVGPAYLIAFWLRWTLPLDTKLGASAALLVVGLASAWTYLAVAKLLGMPETAYVSRAIARGNRAPTPADPAIPP